MIIKRKYVPFWKLKDVDKKAGEIFDKAFNESYVHQDKEWKEKWYQEILTLCLEDREMEWCFDKIRDVIEGFERLDREEPYDNGLTYDDVNTVYIVGQSEDYITLHLVNKYYEVETLVKVVEISDKR